MRAHQFVAAIRQDGSRPQVRDVLGESLDAGLAKRGVGCPCCLSIESPSVAVHRPTRSCPPRVDESLEELTSPFAARVDIRIVVRGDPSPCFCEWSVAHGVQGVMVSNVSCVQRLVVACFRRRYANPREGQ